MSAITTPPVQWDGRKHSYRPGPEWLSRVSPKVALHRELDDELDPVTFEVIRSRLWTSNLAHGETLRRISGSPVFQALDFNMCILTESAELVVNAPFIVYLSAGAPLSVPYIMEHYGDAPGIEDGDMYLASDPWVGVCHQMDVLIACPVFVEERLFAWVCNAGHQYDLGGIVPGGWPQNAPDIYSDPVFFSPFKIVERDTLRSDLESMYRRQSRMPSLLGLDLRSQIAGCRHARSDLLAMCEEFGPRAVKAAMRRILDNTQRTLREKLRAIPDGTYRDSVHLAERMPGDRATYRSQVTVIKQDDRLTVQNAGTDEQMEGSAGFVYTVFVGWMLGALAVTTLWEHGFAVGGAERQLDFDLTPGLLSCVDYPAATAGGVLNGSAVFSSCLRLLSRMLASVPELAEDAATVRDGGALILLTGETDRGAYVGQAVFESNASGAGARALSDGVDMSGSPSSPLMSLLNVEEYEQFFPVMYLYRRERIDGAGAGRQRGGTGSEVAFVPYRARDMSVVTNCGGLFAATHGGRGLFGGLPSPTGELLIVRDTNLRSLFAQGRLPKDIADLDVGETVRLAGKSNATPLGPDDVLAMKFPGGGGYGDPLERDPALVARDVELGYVSREAARALYGVVYANGVDDASTRWLRKQLLDQRTSWEPVRASTPPATRAAATGEPPRPVHEYVVACDQDGERVLACSRCGTRLSGYRGNFKRGLLVDESSPTIIPGVRDPSFFIDETYVVRRYCCPGCHVLMETDLDRQVDPVSEDMRLD